MPGTPRGVSARWRGRSFGWQSSRLPALGLPRLRWWQPDLSAPIIRGLEWLGLAQQVWRIPPERPLVRSRGSGAIH